MNKPEVPKSNPLVTVCIPVYNGEKFILEALGSISAQTYDNYECHIINNASTDKTSELVTEFIKNDRRFILHDQTEFVDLVSNWNRCIDYVSNEAVYFKMVQADDIIMPDSLATHVGLMEKYPDAGIASSYRIVEDYVYGNGIPFLSGEIHDGKQMLLKHLKGKAEITGSITQLFFRISCLKKVPGYPKIFNPENLHVDTRLAFELFLISDLAFSFSVLSYTRRHDQAATVTTVESLNTYIQARETNLYRFKELFPELQEKYSKVRRSYAYFLFKNYLKNNKKCLEWHKKHNKRKITFSEYMSGILRENRISAKFAGTNGQ
jgi:glycosyltransferase involved in cell wall biosynthesis